MGSGEIVKSLNLLVIEDNIADYRLVQEAIMDTGTKYEVNFANISDGNSAIDYFNGRGNNLNNPAPDLILLDLNIPRRPGLDVLTEIKEKDEWQHVPVIVFSSSSSPNDVEKSYKKGANAYVVKPGNLDDFFDAVQSVHQFWVKHVTLHAPHR